MTFSANAKNTLFTFDTGLLSGTLQPIGHRQGIRQLIHKPTGLSLVHPDFSLLNLYLIFATGQCIASARAFKRTITTKSNRVRIHCDPTNQHRANLSLTYHLVSPNVIDLHVAIRTRDDYKAYEALLSNYFDLALKPQFCTSQRDPSQSSKSIHWYTPFAQHQLKNNALVFPRDAQAAQLHHDGRWSNVKSIYQWKTQNYYAHPIALQTHPEHNIAVALMTHPKTCPSFSWTIGIADIHQGSYGSDHLDDPHKARNPIYTSLFGHDLYAPQQYTAHIRLAVIQLDPQMSNLYTAYNTFLSA
ncbi:MAG: hypothetical protein ACI8V2_003940 [Candidatus Latescibacterota bacterium]|jgi:hypothetical protein